MSSRHKDKSNGEAPPNGPVRMETSTTPTAKPDTGTSTCSREQHRRDHNDLEKRRKQQIKICIYKMGELLPPFNLVDRERPSTLDIVEKSLTFMRQLKDDQEKSENELARLSEELEDLRKENAKLTEMVNKADTCAAEPLEIATSLSDTGTAPSDGNTDTKSANTNGVSSTTDVKASSPKPKVKSKRRTINAQIQNLYDIRERQAQAQQEMITSSVSMSEDGVNNIAGNPQMMLPGGQFMANQNMMFNQMMMQGMMGNNGILGNQPSGIVGNQTNETVLSSGFTPGMNSGNKETEDTDAGLLQLAMQDAGITPNSSSQAGQSGSTPVTPVGGSSEGEPGTNSSQSTALQTLASVASNTQGISVEGNNSNVQVMTDNQSATSAATIQSQSNIPLMSGAQTGFPQVMGNNSLVNMQMPGNQSVLQGQQQQIMFINEQGIPCLANLPVGLDPSSQGNQMFANMQKQVPGAGLVPGLNQQTVMKEQTGGIDQNVINNPQLAFAQQQTNMAALQGQLMGQNASANLQNMAFQQQNLLPGGILQNGQFIQQLAPQGQFPPQIQGQGQLVNMQGQGQQGMIIGGQQGNLAISQPNNLLQLNTTPSQPNQLPSALILPNGQIIPVVTNPSNIVSQPGSGGTSTANQMAQARMTVPPMQSQVQLGPDGQVMVGALPNQLVPGQQTTQGLLMTTTAGASGTSSSAGATLNTSVVPTSAIQSLMTTQIQGSILQKSGGASAPMRAEPLVSQSFMSQMSTNSGALLQKSTAQSSLAVQTNPALVTNNQAGIMQQPSGKPSPILITLPINGQPTSVLVDPITMQVLGTVQPQQQTTEPGQVTNQAANQAPAPQSKPATQTTTTGSKSKKKNNPRALVPKPRHEGDQTEATPRSKKKASKGGSKSKESVPITDSITEALQIQIPESTTEPDTSTNVSSQSSLSTTDILAKAVGSIFSSGEMAPIGAFYNPANEDNPLHIDTSAAEGEEQMKKSPEKSIGDVPMTEISSPLTNEVKQTKEIGKVLDDINNKVMPTSDIAPAVCVTVSAEQTTVSAANDDVSSLAATMATLEDIAGMVSDETNLAEISSVENNSILETPKLFEKKKKKVKVSNNAKIDESKKESIPKMNLGNETGQPVTKPSPPKKVAAKAHDKMIPETLIHIPETASMFSEKDLYDVLDHVEQLGNPNIDNSPKVVAPAKKTKSKRSKAGEYGENEPSSKKRKGAKDAKVEIVAKEAPLSMPTGFSVYDFDGTDDIVPQLLPLNAKDFSTTPSKQTSIVQDFLGEFNSKAKQPPVHVQNKTSAQNKNKSTTNSSMNSNSNKSAKNVKDNDIIAQKPPDKPNPSKTLFYFPSDEDIKHDKNKYDSAKTSQHPDPLPSMPDIDTTTSLFGYPVPKKPSMYNSQTAQKQAMNIPKQNNDTPSKDTVASSLSKQSMVSPKQNIVSPKQNTITSKQNTVHPKQNVMLSPKQNVLPVKQNMVFPPQQSPVSAAMVSPNQSQVSPCKQAMISPKKRELASESQRTASSLSPLIKFTPLLETDTVKKVITSALTSTAATAAVASNANNHSVSLTNSTSVTVAPSRNSSLGVITSVHNKPPSDVPNTKDNMNSLFDNKLTVNDRFSNVSRALSPVSQLNSAIVNKPDKSSSEMQPANITDPINSQNVPFSSFNNLNTQKPATIPNHSKQQGNSNYGNIPVSQSVGYNTNSNTNNAPYSKMGPGSSQSQSSMLSPMNNMSSPYSAEALFHSPERSTGIPVVKTSPNVNMSQTNVLTQNKQDSLQKERSNIYSAENFVQSSREDMRNRNEPLTAPNELMNVNDLGRTSNEFSRLQNENSSEAFNFSLGLNLTPITSTASSSTFMDLNLPTSSPVVTATSSSSFSFSLSSTTASSTVKSSGSAGPPGQQQLPFYRMLPSAENVSSQADVNLSTSQNMSNMNMLGHGNNNVIQRNNSVMHSGSSMHSGTSMHSGSGMNSGSSMNSVSSMNTGPGMNSGASMNSVSSMNTGPGMNSASSMNSVSSMNTGSSMHSMRGDNSTISRADTNMSRVDNSIQQMPRRDNSQIGRPDEIHRQDQPGNGNKPSCSKQPKMSTKAKSQSRMNEPQTRMNEPQSRMTEPQSRMNEPQSRMNEPQSRMNEPQSRMTEPPRMNEPFSFGNTNPPPEQNFFKDSQMKSNVGKSPTEQMRKPQEKLMPEMGSVHSRPTNPPQQDKRAGNMDRSPQMNMNTGQPYFSPPNYPPAKSLNTPPLHHPPMMPGDERGRNITNRSPYETPYPGPPSSQPFSSMPHAYPGNRFDGSIPNFPRDNSGTQPLSHTPMNASGRKSAQPNLPPPSNVVNQPKQPAPPLVSMPQQPPPTQPPTQPPRPALSQPSHRPTTPIANPPQPASTTSSRPKQTPSRTSKQAKKSSKQPTFMEVDSNLSNSIFETNRSMTPFFPMQNLSPQSRAMQHEGSPFLPGPNFFHGPRLPGPNSNSHMGKNSEIGAPPFNPLFNPTGRGQTGLGFNFQPGFGMNMNPLHGNHGNGSQITPHSGVGVTPHMGNFNYIFSDVNNSSQNDSLNISPIKFPHANPMLQHQGMDPNSIQHHSQYNRGHGPPGVMSINSILGPNHTFDGRGMNTTMAPPFHHGPPFIPPLNFSMHDH